jgi:hypothetical protein
MGAGVCEGCGEVTRAVRLLAYKFLGDQKPREVRVDVTDESWALKVELHGNNVEVRGGVKSDRCRLCIQGSENKPEASNLPIALEEFVMRIL